MENLSLIHTTLAAGSSMPRAEIPHHEVKAQQVPPVKESFETGVGIKDQEHARFEAVKKAARQIQADSYPISDVRFTIYKEKTGDDFIFVTRFTSLRDGKVTVVPEQSMLAGKEGGMILETLV